MGRKLVSSVAALGEEIATTLHHTSISFAHMHSPAPRRRVCSWLSGRTLGTVLFHMTRMACSIVHDAPWARVVACVALALPETVGPFFLFNGRCLLWSPLCFWRQGWWLPSLLRW